jgi:hypothetical protein
MSKKERIKLNFNKGFLSSGKDLVLGDITVKHPTVEMYWSLGDKFNCEEVYWEYVGNLLCDPYTSMVELDDLGLNYLEQTPFDVFVIRWKNAKKSYLDNKQLYDQLNFNPLDGIKSALQFFLGTHNFELIYLKQDDEYYLVDLSLKNEFGQFIYVISAETYSVIAEFISLVNCIDTSGRVNPANEMTRQMLLKSTRDEIKRRQKDRNSKDDGVDYISGAIDLICSTSNSVNYLSIGKYSIYQLLRSVQLVTKRIHYDNLMYGIYSGNINPDKVKKDELTLID